MAVIGGFDPICKFHVRMKEILETFPRVFCSLPPFSLIRDFGKQNTRRSVSKISVSLTCYRHVRSKSTNPSPLA